MILPLLLLLVCGRAEAWDNHALGTMQSLSAVKVADEKLAPERFEDFLSNSIQNISPILLQVDEWARANLYGYPKAPAPPMAAPTREAFAATMRLNPNYLFALFVQDFGDGSIPEGAPPLDVDKIMLAKGASPLVRKGLLELSPAARPTARLVAASASDEPDYGPDIGLFSDNGSAWGPPLGFGPQPFGNPNYTFSSAAPFHMGFYHEDKILFTAAPFLKKTFPELRLTQYLALARMAFRTGHRYWGWRFTGIGLHYVQDLTQPYHTTVFPNMSTTRLLWVNAKDLAGFHQDKERLIQIVNNRHLALENYLFMRLKNAAPEFIAAMRNTGADAGYPSWSPTYARQIVAKESHNQAAEVDKALTRWLPEKLVDDEKYIFGKTEPGIDVAQILRGGPPDGDANMTVAVLPLATAFGIHSRAFVRAATAP